MTRLTLNGGRTPLARGRRQGVGLQGPSAPTLRARARPSVSPSVATEGRVPSERSALGVLPPSDDRHRLTYGSPMSSVRADRGDLGRRSKPARSARASKRTKPGLKTRATPFT